MIFQVNTAIKCIWKQPPFIISPPKKTVFSVHEQFLLINSCCQNHLNMTTDFYIKWSSIQLQAERFRQQDSRPWLVCLYYKPRSIKINISEEFLTCLITWCKVLVVTILILHDSHGILGTQSNQQQVAIRIAQKHAMRQSGSYQPSWWNSLPW